MSMVPVRLMTPDEARECVERIHAHADGIRTLVLDLYEREGWRALGYESWRACVVAEFSGSQRTLYRQLQSAIISREICQIGKNQDACESREYIPDSHLEPLKRLESSEERRSAYEAAKSAAPNGKVTARQVKAAVDDRITSGGQSRVNGVLVPDPPDVAKARNAGKLARDVVPEVTEPEQDDAPVGPPEDAELSADEWLETLSLRSKLVGRQQAVFDADALIYRALQKPRDGFRYHAARALKAARRQGEYAYRVKRFLAVDHPNRWLLCPSSENGGCSGTGQIPLIGQCPKCKGRGYWIK